MSIPMMGTCAASEHVRLVIRKIRKCCAGRTEERVLVGGGDDFELLGAGVVSEPAPP